MSPLGDAAARCPVGVPVWDRFVRVFHWTLVGCVVFNQFVDDDGKWPHQWAGYLAAALVLARIAWGFVGSRHARFVDFFPTPARLRDHVAALLRGEVPHTDGHNPLGALMMLALLALVLALGVSGWMQTLDAFWGEAWLEEVHEVLADSLLVLAAVHAGSAIVMGRLERTRLVRAMFTGVKERW